MIRLRTVRPTPIYGNEIEAFPLYVKDESSLEQNPTGTIKDRKVAHLMELHLNGEINPRRHWCCITTGNVGASLKYYVELANRKYDANIRAAILIADRKRGGDPSPKNLCGLLDGEFTTTVPINLEGFEIPEDAEEIIRDALGLTKSEPFFDISDGSDRMGYKAYKELARESEWQVKKGFRSRKLPIPDRPFHSIMAPCGSGDLILGVYEGFTEIGVDLKYYGVTIKGENPLPRALELNDPNYVEKDYDPKTKATGLSTPSTGFLPELFELFKQEGNRVIAREDGQLDRSWGRPHRGPMEATSRVTIAALQQLAKEQGLRCGTFQMWCEEAQKHITYRDFRNEIMLVINSGCGFKELNDRVDHKLNLLQRWDKKPENYVFE